MRERPSTRELRDQHADNRLWYAQQRRAEDLVAEQARFEQRLRLREQEHERRRFGDVLLTGTTTPDRTPQTDDTGFLPGAWI